MTTDFKTLWASQTTAPAKEYAPIPTGIYTCQLNGASVALTSDQTNQTVSLKYRICGESEYSGRVLFSNYTLSEKGIYFLKQAMVALGADAAAVEAVENVDQLQALLNKLDGKMCEVTAKARTYTKKDGSEGQAHTVYVNSTMSGTLDAGLLAKTSAPAVAKIDSSDPLPF